MQKTIQVKDRVIGYDQAIFLTAEIGSSHMGDVDLAKEMIRGAARAGCDGVDLNMFESFALPSYRFHDLEHRRFDVDNLQPV